MFEASYVIEKIRDRKDDCLTKLEQASCAIAKLSAGPERDLMRVHHARCIGRIEALNDLAKFFESHGPCPDYFGGDAA